MATKTPPIDLLSNDHNPLAIGQTVYIILDPERKPPSEIRSYDLDDERKHRIPCLQEATVLGVDHKKRTARIRTRRNIEILWHPGMTYREAKVCIYTNYTVARDDLIGRLAAAKPWLLDVIELHEAQHAKIDAERAKRAKSFAAARIAAKKIDTIKLDKYGQTPTSMAI